MAGPFQPAQVSSNYFAGRRNAQDEQYADTRNELAKQSVRHNEQEMDLNKQRFQLQQQQLTAEQQKQVATRLMQAAQYGLQSETPKAFIEQNYPELVQAAGPSWASADDNTVKAQLQDLVGRFGPQAGIGPEAPKGQGAMYKYTKDGKGIYGDATDVRGQPVYESQDERPPPSGYQWVGGKLAPIPGGPADPATPNTKDDTRIFAKADKLRDEFNAQSKDFIAVGDSYNTVKAMAANDSAAGDLSMIFAFMKMLDPTSVVRETEFANAQNAAGIPERIRNSWNKALSGERLSHEQRADFLKQAKNLYGTRKSRNEAVVKRYTEIAKRNKVNPDDVVGDMGVFEDTAPDPAAPAAAPSGQPVQVRTAAEAAALPPGTVFITPDGRRKVRP